MMNSLEAKNTDIVYTDCCCCCYHYFFTGEKVEEGGFRASPSKYRIIINPASSTSFMAEGKLRVCRKENVNKLSAIHLDEDNDEEDNYGNDNYQDCSLIANHFVL